MENIKQSLDFLGYYTNLYGSEHITVSRKVSDEDSRIIHLEDLFCRVFLEGDQLKVLIFGPQIPDERYFATEAQVIAFIKKQFPL